MWKFSLKKNTWKCVQWCLGENGLSDYSGGTAIYLYIASCWMLFKVLEQIQSTACMYKIIVKSAKSALWFYFSLRTNTRYLWTFAIFIIIYTKNITTRHSVQNEKYKYLTCLHVTLTNSVFSHVYPAFSAKHPHIVSILVGCSWLQNKKQYRIPLWWQSIDCWNTHE